MNIRICTSHITNKYAIIIANIKKKLKKPPDSGNSLMFHIPQQEKQKPEKTNYQNDQFIWPVKYWFKWTKCLIRLHGEKKEKERKEI